MPQARQISLHRAKRRDITPLPVLFWTLPKYPNYIIVYCAESKPLQVVAILHGKQNLKEILKDRLPEKP